MILAVVFCVFSLIAIIRLIVYANFTARERNGAGTAMLWVFMVIVAACVVMAIVRL